MPLFGPGQLGPGSASSLCSARCGRTWACRFGCASMGTMWMGSSISLSICSDSWNSSKSRWARVCFSSIDMIDCWIKLFVCFSWGAGGICTIEMNDMDDQVSFVMSLELKRYRDVVGFHSPDKKEGLIAYFAKCFGIAISIRSLISLNTLYKRDAAALSGCPFLFWIFPSLFLPSAFFCQPSPRCSKV